MKRVVIIGGGITGLSAAFSLQNKIDEEQLPASVTLVEASERLGGKIETIHRDGFVIERGPDSYLGRKKSMTKLIEQLGMEDNLVHNHTGQAYILHGRKLHPMPEGAVMGIPTKLTPFISSGLFSMRGKARAGLDLILPKSDAQGDQSVGAFFKRRLGNEVVENLIEPLLSGIYAGNIDRISLQSTFPQFKNIESEYRSLILGMKQTRPPKKKNHSSKGVFMTLKTGLSSLVEELERNLGKRMEIKKGTAVTHLQKGENDYLLQLEDGSSIQADQVIVAAPGRKAGSFFKKEIRERIGNVPATSVATIAMAFPASAIPHDLNGTGFVVSKKSPYTITACTWTHQKWPHTTPTGSVLLRCYVGREHEQAIVEESDAFILSKVLDDLNQIMGVQGKPDFYYVTRWRKAMPQYIVGHQENIAHVQSLLEKDYPGVQLIGASFDGIGLPDCVVAGEKAAERAVKMIRTC
ncbi:protoporphyrinogen oxidase [Pseudalkalibacillus sp. SCS-8]|uniref:protoporphyrinogen oxidase n=1 Tax=Pseudalkalibacillus nanhaiensis TaxID=3115291 RepID=UPI0032DAA1E2